MQISISRARQEFPLSKKKIIKKTITSTLFAWIPFGIILRILSFAVSSNTDNPDVTSQDIEILMFLVTILKIALILTPFVVFIYQYFYFTKYFYELENDHMVIRKGVIAPREITIRYSRIQDLHVDQDLFDRIFGLYDVHVTSASFLSGFLAHIDGVKKDAADGLRSLLLGKISSNLQK